MLGVVGVAVLRGVDGPIDGRQTLGILLCLAGALSYRLCGTLGASLSHRRAPAQVGRLQLLCSTLIIGVVVAVIDQPWSLPLPSQSAMLAVLALAVFGTAIAYLVFFEILVSSGASNVMLVTLLIPVTAVILGSIFLGEQIRAKEIAGALIIATGLLFLDGRVIAWASRKVSSNT